LSALSPVRTRRSKHAAAARQLIGRVLEQLSPARGWSSTLLEIEERSVKEIAELTGWSFRS